MRRLPTVLTVVSAVAALVAGCSSTPSSSTTSASATSTIGSTTAPITSPTSANPSVTDSSSPTASSSTESASSPSPTSSKKASEPLPDGSAILKESSATTAALDSAHLSLSASSSIENMAITALDGDVTRQPAEAAKGYAKIAYRGAREFVKFIVFGGDLYVSQDGGRSWVDYGPAANFYDVASILSPDTGLAGMLTEFIDPEVEGRETIDLGTDEVHTVRISGQVSARAAKKIMPQLQATKRTSCTVWIQETGDHHLVALKLASGADETVVITFSNWNAPVSVGKPRTPRN